MTRRIIAFALILLLVAIAAWAPWVTPEFASQRAVRGFTTAWQGVADGCGVNCTGCGVKTVEKGLFGARVTLEYACGLLPADSPEYHKTYTGWVSFLGTLHGFPVP